MGRSWWRWRLISALFVSLQPPATTAGAVTDAQAPCGRCVTAAEAARQNATATLHPVVVHLKLHKCGGQTTSDALTACHLANDQRWSGCPPGQTGRNIRSHTLLQHYILLHGETASCLSSAAESDLRRPPGPPPPPVHLVLVVREPLAQLVSVLYYFLGRHRFNPDQKEQLLDAPHTLVGDDVRRWLLPGLHRDRSSYFLHQPAHVVLARELAVRAPPPGTRGLTIEPLNASAAADADRRISAAAVRQALEKFHWLSTMDDMGEVRGRAGRAGGGERRASRSPGPRPYRRSERKRSYPPRCHCCTSLHRTCPRS